MMFAVRLVPVVHGREVAVDREARLAPRHLLRVRLGAGGAAELGERGAEGAVSGVGPGDAAEDLDRLGIVAWPRTA